MDSLYKSGLSLSLLVRAFLCLKYLAALLNSHYRVFSQLTVEHSPKPLTYFPPSHKV